MGSFIVRFDVLEQEKLHVRVKDFLALEVETEYFGHDELARVLVVFEGGGLVASAEAIVV